MRRLLLVANPAASGFTASVHRDVTEILGGSFEITRVWPDGPARARSDAADAAVDGFDVVVAMGGDGVVHQVANALIGTQTALGVVPAGTTNVFRRVAGFPRDPREAAEYIAGASAVRSIRTLHISSDDGTGPRTHVATFAAGVGFDAEVIRESERRPLRKVGFGALHYARSVVKVTLGAYRRRRPTLRVRGPGGSIDAVAVQFQVQDEFTFMSRLPLRLGSGPKPIATVLRKVSPVRMVHAIGRAVTRTGVDKVRGVDMWEGFDRVEIDADPPAWIEADGELLGTSARVVAEPSRRDLLVVTA